MWQEEEWLPKDVPVLIRGNCMLYYMARGFQVAKKLTLKSREDLGLSRWVQCNEKGPYIGKWETESETGKCTVKKMQPVTAGFEDEGGHEPKNAAASRRRRITTEERNRFFPRKEHSPADTLLL